MDTLKQYLKSPKYYSLLLVKKIKIYLHNRFEQSIKAQDNVDLGKFITYLWQHLIKNLEFNENGYFVKTKVTNKNDPMVLSQARSVLILSNKDSNIDPKLKSSYLVKKMTDYLISMRDKERGLFKFNQASWDLQDEGIASVWATLALIQAYEYTNTKKYLAVAIETMNSMIKNLYTKETSLIHTEGDDFWCLNSASTFANACSLLLKYHYNEEIKLAMIDSINLCIDKIANDGHYPYNKHRQGTYLLLYHPIVMITLNNCLDSEFIDDETRKRLVRTNNIARDFLISCIDKDNKIFEPEITNYSQYIVTNVTTLVAIKDMISEELKDSLLSNITKYFNNDQLYLCKDKNDRLYNSNLYRVRDVLSVEVLYWLDIYFSDKYLR